MLPPLREEPCWGSPTARVAHAEADRSLEIGALVRSYVLERHPDRQEEQ